MENYVTVIVTNLLPTGTSFAVREDTGEQVFIPASVSKACGLQVSQIAKAILIPNRKEAADVPWMAPVVKVDADTNVMAPDAVQKALDAFDYPVTAEEAGCDPISLHNAHQIGKAVKLVVKERADAKAVVYWTASMDKV